MYMQKEFVERAKQLLPDPSILDVEVPWFSNGERGYRHSLPACQRRNKKVHPLRTTATVTAVLAHRACEYCFEAAVLGLIPESRAFRIIMQSRSNLDTVERRLATVDTPDVAHESIRTARSVRAHLRDIASSTAVESEYGSLIASLDEEAKVLIGRARTRMVETADKLLLPVALSLLSADSNARMKEVADEHEYRMLGDSSTSYYSARHIRQLYSAWEEAQRRNSAEEYLAEQMVIAARRARLERVDQLVGVPLQAADGDLLAVAQASWNAAVLDMLPRLRSRWDARLAQALADDQPVAVLIWRERQRLDDLGLQLLESFSVATRHDERASVLRIPAFVGRWLQNCSGTMYSGEQSAQVVANQDDTCLETALDLWDPTDKASAYRSAQAAVTAAAALLNA